MFSEVQFLITYWFDHWPQIYESLKLYSPLNSRKWILTNVNETTVHVYRLICPHVNVVSVDGFYQVDQNDRVKLMHITYPQKLDLSLFPEASTELEQFVHFHWETMSASSQREYSFQHDMYGVGLMMWEIWTGQKAFQQVVTGLEPRTLLQFIRFLSTNKNSLRLGVEDGLGILAVNAWNDCIIKCQNLSINAADLLNTLAPCKNSTFDYSHAQAPLYRWISNPILSSM